MAENITSKTILKAKLIAIVFALILIYPVIDQTFKITMRKKLNVTKKPLTFPVLDTNKVDTLPKMLEDYYSDRFILQDFLVEVNSYFKIKLLGVSPDQSKAVVGKNRWLFWARYNDNYRGIGTFTDGELIQLKQILDKRSVWYRQNGMRFYLAIPPDKNTIYSEFLPSWMQKVTPLTMYDQVVNLFKYDTLVPVIDMRPRILEAKKTHPLLYFKIDHHWNDIGAYYGYLAIVDRISKDFPQIVPIKYDDYNIDTTERFIAGSESELLNISKWYKEYRYNFIKKIPTKAHDGVKAGYTVPPGFPYPDYYEIVRQTEESKLPYAFFIRDSFADALQTFFDESFGKYKFLYDGWGYMANKEIITKEKPDMVILMPYESNLKNILLNNNNQPQ